ncbi:MAG: pyridoxamine 5'-phosphate oxidase family protein [Pseudomonadota bacterium]
MDDWPTSLNDTLAETWRRLARGVADRRAPARHLVLATAGREGGAEARIVVVRRVVPSEALIDVHTDTASAKIAEIERDPRVSLLVWEERASLQIRLRARVGVGQGEAVAEAWQRVPEAARQVYGGTPAPGQEIATPEHHQSAADSARFSVLSCHIEEIETLHLGRDRHRRALFRASAAWRGVWLAP